MKSRLLMWGTGLAGTLALLLFLTGVVWCVVPSGGCTLPHKVDALTNISFVGSTLLVSFVLSTLGVGGLALIAAFQFLGARMAKQGDMPLQR